MRNARRIHGTSPPVPVTWVTWQVRLIVGVPAASGREQPAVCIQAIHERQEYLLDNMREWHASWFAIFRRAYMPGVRVYAVTAHADSMTSSVDVTWL